MILAKRYGMPWKGSKNAIAPWVVEHIPSADVFIDLFAGGCAVTHAAIESGRFGRFICNDVSGSAGVFVECVNGDFDGYATVPTREEFFADKDDDLALAMMNSFSNDCKTYLWGDRLEEVKVLASRMLSAPSMHERRMAYRKFIKALGKYGLKEARGHNGDLQSLERLQSLQSLQSLELDYMDVGIPSGSVAVYCDPPYRGTNCGGYSGFDTERFDTWLSIVPHMVIVSEYTAPRGCVEVARVEKRVTSAANANKSATERLFVQERYADEYARRMDESRERTLFG